MGEYKEIILMIVSILSLFNAFALTFLGFVQLKENKKQREDIQKIKDYNRTVDEEKIKKKNKGNYCRKIANTFEYINLRGLINPGVQFLKLENIYIKQKVIYVPPNLPSKDPVTFKDFQTAFEKKYNEEDINLKIIIMGPAGSGKSTLLKWIAVQCNHPENVFSKFTPVFFSLKDLGQDPDNTFRKNNLKKLTENHLTGMSVDPPFFQDDFNNNHAIFLFDGLDEVPNRTMRLEIMKWIINQNTVKNPILITTHSSGYQDLKDLDFLPPIPVYNLKEFDYSNIRQFFTRWCENIEIKMSGNSKKENTRKISSGLKVKYSHLNNAIKINERLFQLVKNPLLLTIIAILQVNKDHLIGPMEQHELYEECLKLLIELKERTKSFPWGISLEETVKKCFTYLSQIAFFLVMNNCSEIEKSKIREIISYDQDQLDSCLDDMVNVTGLLYEKAGKYGFSHITFKEYLAALYFARNKKPGDMREYLDNDIQPEIIKMYANLADPGDIQKFFGLIIKNLEKKEYWKQLSLWEDCILNIPDKNPGNDNEPIRYKIEIQFAKRILNILKHLPDKNENEALIISLYPHYPLYIYADQFIDEARDLFNNARHPFVQSIASTILHSCEKNPHADLARARLVKNELIVRLKNRIDDFEKQTGKTQQTYSNFIIQNNNSFPLIFASRQNLLDFFYGLEKLKSGDLFLNFMVLHTLESIVYMLNTNLFLKLLKLPQLGKLLEFLETWKFLEKLNLPFDIDLLALRDFLTLEGYMKLRMDMGDIRIFMEPQYVEKLRGLVDEYETQFKPRLKKLKKDINCWTDNAAAKLFALPDQQLSDYFPGTTEEDMIRFRQGIN